MRPATIAQIAFIVVASLAVFGFVQAAKNDRRREACTALCAMTPNYAGRNLTVPDFELPDMTGQLVKFSSFRGKTVFLNFWTKTCDPCIDEMPSIAELAKIAKTRNDFVVVTVSTDEGPDAVRDTLAVALGGEEVPFPVLFDPESEVVHDRFGTTLFPETWIVDPRGVIRARFDGARDWTNPIGVEVLEMAARRSGTCLVDFTAGQPSGPYAGICKDD